MIERFNFYDIYGYLMPGLAMAMVFTIPYGIVTTHWPNLDLGSALIVIVAAYFVGHLVHGISEGALQSKVARDDKGNRELPSALNLSVKSIFDEDLRARIKKLVQERFGIELDVDTRLDLSSSEHRDIAELRNHVFLLCRPIANKVNPYGEQFQGLSVLARSLSVTFALGFLYSLGWLLFFYQVRLSFAQTLLECSMVAVALLGLWRVFDKWRKHRLIDFLTLLVLAVIVALGGDVIAETLHPSPLNWTASALFASCMLLLATALRFYVSYVYFANQFANAVWRNFAASGTDQE